jgi:hypothetical protein
MGTACNSRYRLTSLKLGIAIAFLCGVSAGKAALCDEIHDAAQRGDLGSVQALVKGNPELVSSRDTNGDTPLHSAVLWNQKEVVAWLLANKADVNARNNDGQTPLHLAAAGGFKPMAELLLNSGADATAKDKHGLIALRVAWMWHHDDVAELLRPTTAAQYRSINEQYVAEHSSDTVSMYQSEGNNTMEISLAQGHIEGDHIDFRLDAIAEFNGTLAFNAKGVVKGANGFRRIKWWGTQDRQWGPWISITESDLIDGEVYISTEDGKSYLVCCFQGANTEGTIIRIGSDEWGLYLKWPQLFTPK